MSANKLFGILLDCGYKTSENGESVIQLYIATNAGIERVEDPEFRPYFYVLSKNPEKTVKELESHDFGEGVKALRAEKSPKKNAENAVKIFFRNTQELVKARDLVKDVEGVIEKREYDIPFANRYLIDKSLKPMAEIEAVAENGIVKEARSTGKKTRELRLASIDLETYSPGRFSDATKDPILMAVISSPEKSVVYTYKKTSAKNAKVFSGEKEMLQAFFTDLRALKPDVIVTYNGDSFDLPYLKTRCDRLRIECDFGFGSVRVVKRGLYNAAELNGVQHFDAFQVLKFMARIGAVSLMKFDLENVSEKVFGKPKEKVPAADINKSWDAGTIDKVVEYNREDGEVTLKLAEEFMPLEVELCKMLGWTLYETTRASSSQMVEQLLITKSFQQGSLIPNRPLESQITERQEQTYEGGFVKEPLAGLHENIAVLDFRSLHPSIMIAHNIGPETLKCPHEECRKGKNVSPDDDWFCQKNKGFLSGILEEILSKRIELKSQLKTLEKGTHEYRTIKARQHALKILLNSHYGYLGYPRSRWYSRESARAITAWSRQYIQKVNERAEKEGFKSLYSDTDSAFLIIPKGLGEKEVKEFVKKVNDSLPEAMELEFEGMFRRGIFVTKKEGGAAKKKYALIDFSGNLKIVGFEYVRRDWASIAKETQKKVIEAVLKEGNAEKAVAIAREVISNLKEGKTPKKELVIMTQLKRRPEKYDAIGPHVAAAKKAIERGKDIDVGSILGFIVTKGSGKSISEKAELEEYVQEGNYDADYYIEHQVIPAVIKIIRELGFEKEDLIHGGKQSSLFKFT